MYLHKFARFFTFLYTNTQICHSFLLMQQHTHICQALHSHALTFIHEYTQSPQIHRYTFIVTYWHSTMHSLASTLIFPYTRTTNTILPTLENVY